MMTIDEMRASIAALQPAPAGESMEQIARRAAHWILTTIQDEHDAIRVTASLYERAVAGDMPIAAEWTANIDALALARALDLDRALDLALALALDRARALDLALALDRARALDLYDDLLITLLGARLQPLPTLHQDVLWCVEAGSLDMSAWHTCETQHCRAGWANTIHPLGMELERHFGPEWAGRVIYKVSTGMVADIRRCAGLSTNSSEGSQA